MTEASIHLFIFIHHATIWCFYNSHFFLCLAAEIKASNHKCTKWKKKWRVNFLSIYPFCVHTHTDPHTLCSWVCLPLYIIFFWVTCFIIIFHDFFDAMLLCNILMCTTDEHSSCLISWCYIATVGYCVRMHSVAVYKWWRTCSVSKSCVKASHCVAMRMRTSSVSRFFLHTTRIQLQDFCIIFNFPLLISIFCSLKI